MNDAERDLTDFTDQVLSQPQTSYPLADLSPEEQLVVKLRALMPSQQGLDPAFKQRMNTQMNREWEALRHPRRRTSRWGRSVRQRWYAAAAVLVIALVGVGVALSLQGQDDPTKPPLGPRGTVGTAANESLSLNTVLLLGGVLALSVLAAVLIYGWWTRRR